MCCLCLLAGIPGGLGSRYTVDVLRKGKLSLDEHIAAREIQIPPPSREESDKSWTQEHRETQEHRARQCQALSGSQGLEVLRCRSQCRNVIHDRARGNATSYSCHGSGCSLPSSWSCSTEKECCTSCPQISSVLQNLK